MCKCLCGVCHDDWMETLNAFLIPQTPYPVRSEGELFCVNNGLALCFPIRLMEGMALCMWGLITLPLPCIVCKSDTYHSGDDIKLECCYPTCRCLANPFRAKYYGGGKNFTGCVIGKTPFFGNTRPRGRNGYYSLTSETSSCTCLVGGFQKMSSAVCDVFCCPVNWCCYSYRCCCE